MLKRYQILTVLLIVGVALISACAPPPPPVAPDAGMANPAAVHCLEQGHQYEIRSDDAGNEYGICIFPDGSECDAWAYFRDECQPAGEKPIGMANPASVHCQEQGYDLEVRTDANGNQLGVCVFPDGSECEEWAYFRGECQPGGNTPLVGTQINLVERLNLAKTEQIDIFTILQQPDSTAAEAQPGASTPLLTITDPETVSALISALDTDLELRLGVSCISIYTLRFQTSDGAVQELQYGCDPNAPDFLRGNQGFWQGTEAPTPDEFNALMKKLIATAQTPESSMSGIRREPAPPVPAADLEALTAGNNAFAFDLFQTIRANDRNLFFSPYSISLALAMTYAGARTETEQQMADTLHFSLDQDDLHPTFNALDQTLAGRNEPGGAEEEGGFQLNIANALWGQAGYHFLPEFLDVLATNYGAGMNLLDFAADPEAARVTINDWVSDQTEERIQDLLPRGSLDALTRLVLTNAIYFKADWSHPFKEYDTSDRSFTLLDGSEITTPMMQKEGWYGYGQGADYQAVRLPYAGDQVSMLVLMPTGGEFDAFSRELDTERLDEVMRSIREQKIDLTLPKFSFESEIQLRQTLTQMGMALAFDAATADFSGMDGSRDLHIDDVYHKAFVAVDEEGTEAAAATAVVMMEMAAMPEEIPAVTIDHPFLFLIQDNPTGSILFMGQVVKP
jgi:serpin B